MTPFFPKGMYKIYQRTKKKFVKVAKQSFYTIPVLFMMMSLSLRSNNGATEDTNPP